MRWIDPHDDRFWAKNLDKEIWFEFQRDLEIDKEVLDLQLAFAEEACLVYDKEALNEVAMRVFASCELPYHRLQTDNYYWAAMAMCMLSHGRMMVRESDVAIGKSPIEQQPMYYDNIEYVEEGRWLVPRRKNETKDPGAPRHRQNYKVNAVSRGGNKERYISLQGSLFDLHEGGES